MTISITSRVMLYGAAAAALLMTSTLGASAQIGVGAEVGGVSAGVGIGDGGVGAGASVGGASAGAGVGGTSSGGVGAGAGVGVGDAASAGVGVGNRRPRVVGQRRPEWQRTWWPARRAVRHTGAACSSGRACGRRRQSRQHRKGRCGSAMIGGSRAATAGAGVTSGAARQVSAQRSAGPPRRPQVPASMPRPAMPASARPSVAAAPTRQPQVPASIPPRPALPAAGATGAQRIDPPSPVASPAVVRYSVASPRRSAAHRARLPVR